MSPLNFVLKFHLNNQNDKMIETTVVPQQTDILLSLPIEYIGKKVRILMYAVEEIVEKTAAKPKASDGNAAHIGAPMPGSIASVAVTVGQKVNAGDLLLTIEAMKMETGLHADRAATVKALYVQVGSQIDAKDLLVELE